MYAMQGTMSVGAFMRSLGSARAPWLTVDAAAESRRQEHCGETGRFLSGAVHELPVPGVPELLGTGAGQTAQAEANSPGAGGQPASAPVRGGVRSWRPFT